MSSSRVLEDLGGMFAGRLGLPDSFSTIISSMVFVKQCGLFLKASFEQIEIHFLGFEDSEFDNRKIMIGQKVCCQFSSDYFSGFKVEIDISNITELDEIVKICKRSLIDVLVTHNFESLIVRASKIKFHIHQPETLQQARENPLDVIWICDHREEDEPYSFQ
jgi:hypothetical protein